jgi:hypothetical protein
MNLAPNGKPSNLTPEQYRLVRTPEFKAWFGDWENSPETSSKVVDENGEPLVVFHGSPYGTLFNVFDGSDRGNWFGEDIKIAETYRDKYVEDWEQLYEDNEIEERKKERKIFKVFLKSKKIYDLSFIDAQAEQTKEEFNKIFPVNLRWGGYETIGTPHWELFQENYGIIKEWLIKNKYDCIKIKERGYITYGVFQSTQIKLADGTNTTFDSNNPDIRYEIGGIFHGSHYFFDKFSTEKIGTGIGQQEDGWGIYLTDDFKSSLNYGQYIYKTTLFKGKNIDEYIFLDLKKSVKKDLVSNIVEALYKYYNRDFDINKFNLYYDYIKDNSLPKVDFNDFELISFDYSGYLFYKTLSRILGGDKKASLFLLDNGIDGLRSILENSKGVVYRTDYVIFDENAITIESREHLPNNYYYNGGSILDLLSSQEVEQKLGRELHWWNDDIVYLSNIKYKKVYLRPEYKKVI